MHCTTFLRRVAFCLLVFAGPVLMMSGCGGEDMTAFEETPPELDPTLDPETDETLNPQAGDAVDDPTIQ